MSKNDQQEAFEKILSGMLARTIDFIKFAEAKSAALLTLSSAWIIATSGIALSDKVTDNSAKTFLYLSTTSFVVAALLSVYALLPQLRLSKFLQSEFRPANLIYFGDIQSLKISDFREQLKRRYMPADGMSATDDYLADLSDQIMVNSQIANRKFKISNVSARFLFLGVAILSCPALARLVDALKVISQ